MSRLDEEFDIVRESDFFLAIAALRVGLIDAIFGPQGGILVLDKYGCLVYRKPLEGYKGVYLSADNIMSFHWRWLLDRFKRAVDITPSKEIPKPSQESADKNTESKSLDDQISDLCGSCNVSRCPGPCEEYSKLLHEDSKKKKTPKERFGTMEFDSDSKSHMND